MLLNFLSKTFWQFNNIEHIFWQGMQQCFSISTQLSVFYNIPYVQLGCLKHVRKLYILSYCFDVLPGSWLQYANNIIIDSYTHNPAITLQGIPTYVDLLVNAYDMNIKSYLSKLAQL